jgi:hypothetical protein
VFLNGMMWRNKNSCNVVFVGKSQGRMHYVNNSAKTIYTLTVWIFQGDDNWIAKTHHQYSRGSWTKIPGHV